jgi:hypothetical protein
MHRKWVLRTSISRLFGVAVGAEILPSLCLWALSPTDTIRVWYPSVWSYLGEHFLVWSALLLLLLSLLKGAREELQLLIPNSSKPQSHLLTFHEYVAFAGLLLAADVAASLVLVGTTWLRDEAFTTKMWYTHSLRDYLLTREPIFLFVLVAASIILSRPARNQADGSARQAGDVTTN